MRATISAGLFNDSPRKYLAPPGRLSQFATECLAPTGVPTRRTDWAPSGGGGWQGLSSELQLTVWSRKRRLVVLWRAIRESLAIPAGSEAGGQGELFGTVEVPRADGKKLSLSERIAVARLQRHSADNALGPHNNNLFIPPKVRFVKRQ